MSNVGKPFWPSGIISLSNSNLSSFSLTVCVAFACEFVTLEHPFNRRQLSNLLWATKYSALKHIPNPIGQNINTEDKIHVFLLP